ncbi:MAG: transglutaminase domain-containing protein [Bacteroidia bacterium]
MKRSLSLLILVFFAFHFSSFAEGGWDSIKNNNDIAARQAFSNALKADSTDVSALEGMIYLSEIEQDELSYKKYINKLIDKTHNENIYLLFQDLYTGKDEDVVKQKNYSEVAKISAEVDIALTLKQKRQFSQSDKAYADLFGHYKWSFLGPFQDISGSGYEIPYLVETDKYDTSKAYTNSTGILFSWVNPAYETNEGDISFGDFLPDSYKKNVFYANTFVNASKDETVQFRIGRTSPMKIWLDNDLVFSNNDPINFSMDNEIVQLKIKAGIHRILVKSVDADDAPKTYDFLDFEDAVNGSSGGGNNYGNLFGLGDGGNDQHFCLRITDTLGHLETSIQPANTRNYTSQKYDASKKSFQTIDYFKQEITAHPDNLFNYYALSKAYISQGLNRQAEEFFVKAYRAHKKIVLFKYLAAKLYAENGKIEKSYEILADINQDKTPIFGMLYEKFQDIDLNTDEDRYLSALEKLKSITPSNYQVIKAYIHYYDKKGMQKEHDDFIKKMKEAYPVYTDKLNYEASLSDNKPYQEETDKQKKEESKQAVSNTKTQFFENDYNDAIEYYKGKNKFDKVIDLYNDLIAHEPYDISARKAKAKYLYSEEKYDAALQELNIILKISPYESGTLEIIGDIYSDLGKKDSLNYKKALTYYLKSKQYSGDGSGLDDKIDQIQGQKTLKTLFTDTKTLDEALRDTTWQGKYNDAESVILLYTRDLAYDSTAHAEVYQQMMIKILTAAGAKIWTQYDFSFLGNINMVKVIKPNGAEVVPDQNGGYIVFKNLEPGDIIELNGIYKWQQQSELGKVFALISYLSFEAPVYYSKMEVAVPKGMYLGYLYQNMDSNLVKFSKGNYDFYKWEYHLIPKIEQEEATLDNYDLYGSITVSSIPDWSIPVNWYQKKTYRKFEMSYDVKEAMDSVINPSMSDSEKVIAIYNYVTRQISYSYVPFLQSGYVPKDPSLTLSSKIGDCKDVATLMITMLRAIGVESYYTLVKTNSLNHQDMLPSLNFDHVVVCYYLHGKQGFLDLTTDFYPSYVLTENDVNAWGLLIKDGVKTALRLPKDNLDSLKNLVEYTEDATLNTDESIDMKTSAVYPGMAGGAIRETFSTISEAEQKNYILGALGKNVFQNLSLTDFKYANLNDISAPLKATYALKASDFSDAVANLFICRIPYMTAIQPSAAIASKVRRNRLSVDALGKDGPVLQKITLHFPKGYRLLEVPKNIYIHSKYGVYSVHFKAVKDGLYVEKYQCFFKDIIPVDEFQNFKTYYLRILNQDKLKIAIQKMQ